MSDQATFAPQSPAFTSSSGYSITGPSQSSTALRTSPPMWDSQPTSTLSSTATSQGSANVPNSASSVTQSLDAPLVSPGPAQPLLPPLDISLQPRGFPQQQPQIDRESMYGGQSEYPTPRYGLYQPPQGGVAMGHLLPHPQSRQTSYSMPPVAGDVDPWFTAGATQPVQQSRQSTKKGKGQKKADGKQPTFLTKLYSILEQPEYHHIIRWDEAGELIVIERPDELSEKILPLVYRQSRFASFSRQLNIYGWMRKVSLRHVESGIVDPDASTWAHPFLRHNSTKEEILGFKRRVPPRPSQAQKHAARMAAEGLAVSSDSDSFHSPTDAYQHSSLGSLEEAKQIMHFGHDGAYLPALANNAQEGASTRNEWPKVNPRRFSMPSQLPGSDDTKAGTLSMARSFTDPVVTGTFIPQSAPPNTASFTVTSATRSSDIPLSQAVPSTTKGFTVVGTGLWLGNQTFSKASDTNNPFLQGSMDTPTFRPENPATFRPEEPANWRRGGMGIVGDGLRPGQTVGPTFYGPGTPVPYFFSHQPPSVPLTPVGHSHMRSLSMSSSTGQPGTPASAGCQPLTPPQTAGGPLPIVQQTVSPGIYQAGFAQQQQQQQTGSRSWITPRSASQQGHPGSILGVTRVSPTPTKEERRHSGSGPYSPPRDRCGPGLTGVVRGINRDKSRLSYISTTASSTGSQDDGGLPSANLQGQPELFGGELETAATVDMVDAYVAHYNRLGQTLTGYQQW